MTPLLQITSVEKSFGAVRALKGVSFDLQQGEVHALLGENGAGKSTLIKIITGAHQPDHGTIEIAGQIIRHLTPAAAHKLGIACIYQQPALCPDLSVVENIALRLEPATAARRVNWTERRVRAAHLLLRIGANIEPELEVRHLSMPEQQLVEIACALGTGALIVIMDEPTASLTQREQQRLFGVVRDLRQSGTGVIYISHRLDEIFALADRVTVLRDGQSVGTRIIASGQSHEKQAPSSATITETELIKMMVGREISALYPVEETRGPAAEQPRWGERTREPNRHPTSSAREDTRPTGASELGLGKATDEPARSPVVLSLKNVGCTVSGIRNINLEICPGEIVGLAGLVGAGRTELARVLFGLTPANSGEIHLNGERVCIQSPQDAVARGIAYMPEDRRRHGVILEMSVASNMTMAIHRRIFPGGLLRFGAENELALEFIRDLDVRTYGPDAPGNSLSGGNQQKVSLARWLATKPKLLILDEPTQGVDIGAKSEIHKLIRSLTGRGLAVLMISSDLPEVLGLSDRIAVMREGTIARSFPGKANATEVMGAALGQMAC